MSEDQAIRDGEKVEQFLKDEAVINAFAKVEQQYVAEWKSSEDPEKREALWAKQRALSDVQAKLRASVGDGQIAKSRKEQRIRTELATARRGQ